MPPSLVSTRILGKTMRDAVRNKESWKRRHAWPWRVARAIPHRDAEGEGEVETLEQPILEIVALDHAEVLHGLIAYAEY